MSTTTRSIPAGIAFIIASFTIGVWVYPIMRFPLLLLVVPICLSLQIFLIHRGVASFGFSNSTTKRVDGFLYETRNGSMTLLALSILWGLFTFWGGAVALLDLCFGGTTNAKLHKLANPFVIFIFQVMTFFTFVGVMGWTITTAGKALWRITTPEELGEENRRRLVHDDEERVGADDESILGRFRL